MAALCTGNYGLTQNCIDTSKEYFFVKLTDSALRAVEEYQKNQGKHNSQPTIQIDGNSGVISFPSSGQQFRFSIDEIEGSFECIKQTQNQLEVQGSLPFKLRIHANDDVYETTKHRMAVAEENQKNKCTREIKPNQTDIGRKVKLKSSRHANIPPKRDPLLTSSSSSLTSGTLGSTSSQSPLSSSTTSSLLSSSSSTTASLINPASSTHQQFSTGSVTTMSPLSTSSGTSGYSSSSISPLHSSSLKSSSNSINNNLSNSSLNSSSSSKLHSNYHNNVTSASSLSSALSSAAGSGTSGITSSYYGSNNSRGSSGIGSTNNSLNSSASRRSVAGVGANQRNQRNGGRHMPDITKRKLRDRLIHLLALKPYKKPELYARLQNEGIREREKASISVILKEISTMRDNTYNLKRQMWNDVIEDWPFYTEQELQMLKRRKPQNLTPPISSDGGSSTSGQSPTSTHNGSPPPAVKRPSLDHDRYYGEPIMKKPRISHFRKDNNEINRWSRRSGVPEPRDLPIMNSRSRESHEMRSSSYYGSNLSKHQEPEDNAMSLSYGVLGSEAARRISPRDELSNLNGHSNSSMNTSTSHHHSSIIPNSHHTINNNTSNNNNNNTNSSNKNNSTNSILSSSGGGSGGGGGNNTHHKSSPLYSSSNGNTCNSSGNNGNRISDSRQKGSSASVSSPRIGSSMGGGDMVDDSSRSGVIGHGIGDTMSPGAGSRGSAINNHSNDNVSGNHGSSNSKNKNSSSSSASKDHSGNILSATNSSKDRPTISSTPSQPLYDFSEFKSINSVEQRRTYKAEFEKDYAEYRKLLEMVEGVSKKFKMLALQLEENKNDSAAYREIRRKILSEYEKTNRDYQHQKRKARFDYLHAKLAHIKALVHDFDQTLTSSGGSAAPTQSPLQQNMGADSLTSENFGNVGGNITNSPSLSRRNGGNSSSQRISSSPIMNGNLGNSPPGLHHHLSENY